ncbi:sirohydrochlorin chelatase [Paenibacillus sambharensis]|uniref:Sirohydrochlorin chelatase n=1 Tax=Paenibacillus sambharensis TaxID=1803190 RepID=A0A2W1LA88_9BACL|nr:sirohydrochlorin chelatase [Paenibacillus sambharensis]PZD96136.1 sirohydrochlorin chelatase [Paenibacillus sambharensis]
MEAVLFVGHGSKDSAGNNEVRAIIEAIRGRLDVPIVETCFLEFEPPGLISGMEACVRQGATRVGVVPIMLFTAGHAKIHIPAAIDDMKLKYPDVVFEYGRPIGVHELVLTILQERMNEGGYARQGEQSLGGADGRSRSDVAVLVIGRGSSDPDANSDLFKMSRLLWERLDVKLVETAFIGVTAPLMDEGVERCLKLGAKHVYVLPYFLFTGVLIKRMEQFVEDLRVQYPEHAFTLAPYFGFHPMLQEVLRERAIEALRGEAKMNCATCQYRLAAMEHIDHHHHHDHEHGHDHHHHHHHDHSHGHDHHHHHDHSHEHSHGHDHHDHSGEDDHEHKPAEKVLIQAVKP